MILPGALGELNVIANSGAARLRSRAGRERKASKRMFCKTRKQGFAEHAN